MLAFLDTTENNMYIVLNQAWAVLQHAFLQTHASNEVNEDCWKMGGRRRKEWKW